MGHFVPEGDYLAYRRVRHDIAKGCMRISVNTRTVANMTLPDVAVRVSTDATPASPPPTDMDQGEVTVTGSISGVARFDETVWHRCCNKTELEVVK